LMFTRANCHGTDLRYGLGQDAHRGHQQQGG